MNKKLNLSLLEGIQFNIIKLQETFLPKGKRLSIFWKKMHLCNRIENNWIQELIVFRTKVSQRGGGMYYVA